MNSFLVIHQNGITLHVESSSCWQQDHISRYQLHWWYCGLCPEERNLFMIRVLNFYCKRSLLANVVTLSDHLKYPKALLPTLSDTRGIFSHFAHSHITLTCWFSLFAPVYLFVLDNRSWQKLPIVYHQILCQSKFAYWSFHTGIRWHICYCVLDLLCVNCYFCYNKCHGRG